MKRRNPIFMIGLLVLLTFLFIPDAVHSVYFSKSSSKQTQAQFAPGRLIVKMSPEADKKIFLGEVKGIITTGLSGLDSLNLKFRVQKQAKLFEAFKETALKLDQFSGVYIVKVPEETDLQQMKAEYESLPEVEYAESDYKVKLFEEPDDPLFPHQWYLNNLGQAQNGGQGYYGIERNGTHTLVMKFGTEDADIDALEAFQRGDETTVPLVGIIDTGVDVDHEDLAENVWTNPGEIPDNDLDDDHNGFVDDFYGWDFSGDSVSMEPVEDNDPADYYGHGTHCAGIVAAVRGNAVGVSGINTPCNIMAVKIFPFALSSVCARGIIYAADMGCDVINMSWGGPYPSYVLKDALNYALSKGTLPIAAAGNSGQEDYFYPASLPQVLTVGASNSDGQVTYFSTYGDHIEVVAPGRDILSLRADSTDMYAEDGFPLTHIINERYYLADGTSMSSPCAAGIAAYIVAASPGISTQKVKEIVEQSADDIIYPYGGDTLYSPGKDIYSGYGRVNLNSALQLLRGRLAKIDYPYENAVVSGDVPILGTASGDSFQSYTLEYGEGYYPSTWVSIAGSDVPVSKDTLGIWTSSGLTGRYTLRLTVGDENQAAVHLLAGNETYVKITSPSNGDTVRGLAQVYGYTIAPDFSHYTLEYGYGDSPCNWDTITTSSRMAAGDILGDWFISFLEETNCTVRLTTKIGSGEIYTDSVIVFVRSPTAGVWVQDLPSWGSLSPAVGDVDGDGFDEVVVGIGGPPGWSRVGGITVFSHEGEVESGWPRDTLKNMMSSPALGDLDKDGIDDIAICSEQQGVHAYLSGSSDWTGSAGTGGNSLWSLATPVIADLEGDGDLEVLMVNSSGRVYAWRKNGESVIPDGNGLFAQVAGCGTMGFPCMAVADLDKDEANEVIIATSRLHILDVQGNQLLGPQDYQEALRETYGIAVADIDEGDDLEVIVFGSDTSFCTLFAFKKDGTQVTNYPLLLEDLLCHSWFGNHPAVGDLEGDGILEIVVSVWTLGEGRIYGWHQDGTPLGSVGSRGLLVSLKSPDSEAKKELLSNLGNDIAEAVAQIRSMSQEDLESLLSTFGHDPIFVSAGETMGNPILADVNQNACVDVIARTGWWGSIGYETLHAWDYEGSVIPGFPLYATAQPATEPGMPYSPVVADMDKDAKMDIVLATSWPRFTLISWKFDSYFDSTTMHWPKYGHDKYNSGIFEIEEYTGYGIAYVVYLINYIFKGGPAPEPFERGDVNCDDKVDLQDVVYLINYLFKGGPEPC